MGQCDNCRRRHHRCRCRRYRSYFYHLHPEITHTRSIDRHTIIIFQYFRSFSFSFGYAICLLTGFTFTRAVSRLHNDVVFVCAINLLIEFVCSRLVHLVHSHTFIRIAYFHCKWVGNVLSRSLARPLSIYEMLLKMRKFIIISFGLFGFFDT